MANESLYRRLGGYDSIAAVVDDFSTQVANDSILKKYFDNLSDDSANRVQQLTTDFIVQAVGGPTIYLGRDMQTAHQGMGINEIEWKHAVRLLKNILTDHNCTPADIEELSECIGSLKEMIVQK